MTRRDYAPLTPLASTTVDGRGMSGSLPLALMQPIGFELLIRSGLEGKAMASTVVTRARRPSLAGVALFALFLLALVLHTVFDRLTPYTSEATLQAPVVGVAPNVRGPITGTAHDGPAAIRRTVTTERAAVGIGCSPATATIAVNG